MKWLTTALLLVVPTLAIAQSPMAGLDQWGVVTGKVYDARTHAPLGFCNVVITPLQIGAFTFDDGSFLVRDVLPGTYRLIVSYIGYATYIEDNVTVAPGKLVSRTIYLEPSVLEAEPVVVTATRKPQTAKMTPATVLVRNATDIANSQSSTFDQVLETMPGVQAYRSTPVSVQSMSIRGSSDVAGGGVGNRVLLLVDGRPALTSDSGGAFWNLVPVSFIDRVEVVKGAFSSLYGSTAMGGVVNVITRRPSLQPSAQVDVKYGVVERPPGEIRYTGHIAQHSEVNLGYSGTTGGVGYLVGASRKQSDGHAEGTTFELYDLYSKLLFDLKDNRNLEVAVAGGSGENEYPHSWLSSAQPLEIRDKYHDDRQEKKYWSADLLYWAVPGTRIKYSTRFYYHHHEQRSFFNENDPQQTIPGNEPFGTTTMVDGDKIGNITQADIYFSDDHYLVTGFDAQTDFVQSAPDTVMYGDHQINNAAVFAQDEIGVLPGLSLTVGARYDWNHLVDGKTLQQFSPKIAMVWAPVSRMSFRALYGRAFRAPTIAELFFQKEIAGGIDFVPNPDLTAERMDFSLELGMRVSPWNAINVDAALFRYDYEDMIFWENVSADYGVSYPLFQVRNLNSALVQGAETTVTAQWRDRAATSVGYTYLKAEDRSPGRTDDTLPYHPAHSLKIAGDMRAWRLSFHVDTRYRSAIQEVFLYPLQAPEAFWVSNTIVRLNVNRFMTLSLKTSNIFDKQYEELARYRMPGRTWTFGTTISY